jgi:asparagine synthase (glutamine-hydrolysing)
MCGITGFIDFNGQSNEELLLDMLSNLSHRGPNGSGHFYHISKSANIGLGHRRLSIIDLNSSASQPQHFDDFYIVFNGEIYNHKEIRAELLDLGHNFTTNSDTEVILHSWRQWGESAIDRWRGMFAISLYDEKSAELILIRDRSGVKPLFYYWEKNIFLFSSELKSFHEHPAFEKKINKAALALFLQYGNVPSPHCIFENTYKLLPGHILRFSLTDQQFKTNRYWSVYDAYNQPKLKISVADAINETERILAESFRYRMVADVPVGVFLSGGYDSTCVAALLQSQQTAKLRTFTIGTNDATLDEAPYARSIARHLGTDHTEFYCSAKEALDIIPDLPFYYDEPFADSSAIPTILLSRLAKKSVTVALSADGGDEIFAGYNRYDYINRYARKIQGIPSFLRRLMATGIDSIPSRSIPFFRYRANFHSRYEKLKNLLHNPTEAELLKNLSQVFSSDELNRLMVDKIVLPETLYDRSELNPDYHDPLSYMMAMDYQTYMLDDILTKVDRATMSTGLEGREPFLDQHIIEWAAKLPSDIKLYKGQKKYLLRQIVHKYIPANMMDRPKMGFGIPVQDWLSNELKDLLLDHFSDSSLAKHSYFNNTSAKTLVDEFLSGRKELYLKVWHLLMFQMWYSKWMSNESC